MAIKVTAEPEVNFQPYDFQEYTPLVYGLPFLLFRLFIVI